MTRLQSALGWALATVLLSCSAGSPARTAQPGLALAAAPPGDAAAPATGSPEESARAYDAAAPVPVEGDDPVWGSRTAPVTIVELSDLQCPFCAQVQSTLDRIKSLYGPDKIRLVWKDVPLPFHPHAMPAAEAGRAVFALGGNDAFWQFHRLAFAHQNDLGIERYLAWAREAGVTDEDAIRRALETHSLAGKIDRSLELARTLGRLSTPRFYINGVQIDGAVPFETFQQTIDEQLEKAHKALADGTKPHELYLALSKANREQTPGSAQTSEPPEPEEDKTAWRVPVGHRPSLGPEYALVTIIEFTDYQCPFCKSAEDTLKEVRAKYGSKVRVVVRSTPLAFHDRAEPAAQLAAFAWRTKGNTAFFAAHERLFAEQEHLDDDGLRTIAKDVGLDVNAAMRAVHTHRYEAALQEDADLADDLHVASTPYFFINGRRLAGAQPIAKFQSVIDEELARAEGLSAKLRTPDTVYAEVLRNAKAPDPPERKEVALPAAPLPSKGGPHAKVVIQEFSDFQCPFCARVQPTLEQVLSTYGNQVRLVFRHRVLAMHADAPRAAEAATEAFRQKGSAGFWKMHDLLFQHQAEEGGLAPAALERYAGQVGLDVRAFRTALTTHTHQATIESEAHAADAAGITGTPSFVINGYFVSGAQPLSKFRRAIERALREAK